VKIEDRENVRLVLAAVAMHGMFSSMSPDKPFRPDQLASDAFKVADALLSQSEVQR